ncbi:MAG TPA: glycosyltransferase family 4 protein [Gaiellaceae bacterium]|nr:glycosyltransferase family 4 protein [Gaiellaceae bacterium]
MNNGGDSRTRKPRVCIVREMDEYEPPVQREAEALVSAGFDVEVLCMRHPNRPRRVAVNGVDITSLPAKHGRSTRLRYVADYGWFFVLAAATLTGRHLRRRYAVVQINTMPDFLVFAAAIPKLLGSRVVLYLNEPVPELADTLFGSPRLRRVLERVEQRSIRFADRAITVTEQLRQRFVERGADGERISVVLNGADPAVRIGSWRPPPAATQNGFTVMSHGLIEERYGQETLVEAAGLLRDEIPGLRVVLTGRGTRVPALLEQVRALRLDDVVSFEGWVPHERLNDLLHEADVGVVAQKASPYSHLVHTNKMVDYWLFDRPVIASRLRAVSETYEDDVLEYYEPGDAEDLARAIRKLHADPGRRAALVRAARSALERKGWAVQRKIYLDVFEELVRDRGTAVASEPAPSR